MSVLHAILLGILQGLTEFIPVSSTAHLLIGQTLLRIPPGEAVFSFLVIVQWGTILSLLIFFWKDLVEILRATLLSLGPLLKRRDREMDSTARLGWYILLATLPALLAGYLLKDAVEALFQTPLLEAAIRLLTAALLLALAEWLTKKSRSLTSINWVDALVIGLFQIIAVFPGASRSGTTIAAGMFRGLDRRSAARFAFLMSIPVMLAAGAYQMLDLLRLPGLTAFLPLLLAGFVTAAVFGWLTVKWLLAYLNNHSLYVFAVYCAIGGAACLVFSLL